MYQQVELSYAFDALEPHIDTLTMQTHYTKHHAAYTKNLNDAAQKAGVANMEITELLSHLSEIKDDALRTALRNNGGGFFNHNLYFSTLSPSGGGKPEGEFGQVIEKQFGSFEQLKEKLSALAMGQFGSGWAWLSADRLGRLSLSSSPNQDNPIIEGTAATPILALDVWEHAYYLKYKNLRADYIAAFFEVIDWKIVAANYSRVTGQ